MSVRAGLTALWRIVACAAGVFMLSGPGAALAQAAEPRVASGTLVSPNLTLGGSGSTAVPSVGVGSLLQTLFGLLVVLAVVVGVAWLVRRFGLQAPRLGNTVKVVGGVMLSAKERVVVVEVQDTWLVLGVAPGSVNMLHRLPAEPSGGGRPAGAAPTAFAERLRESIGQRFGHRAGGAKERDTL
jgi:flagellar protein FliO/FliZ